MCLFLADVCESVCIYTLSVNHYSLLIHLVVRSDSPSNLLKVSKSAQSSGQSVLMWHWMTNALTQVDHEWCRCRFAWLGLNEVLMSCHKPKWPSGGFCGEILRFGHFVDRMSIPWPSLLLYFNASQACPPWPLDASLELRTDWTCSFTLVNTTFSAQIQPSGRELRVCLLSIWSSESCKDNPRTTNALSHTYQHIQD